MTLLLGLTVLCLGWLVPGHFYPWLSFQQEWVAGTGAALIGFAALRPTARQRIQWPVLALLTLAVAAIPLLQLWAGQIRFVSDALLAALYLVAFALAMVAGATLAQTRRTELIGGLFGAILVAAIVSTGMALAQWLQLGPIGYVGDLNDAARAYANFGQPNHLATLLAMAIVGLLWLFETRRIGVLATGLALAWLGTGLVATQSRTGWLFVIALAISAVVMWRRGALRTRLPAVATAVLLFFALAASWQSLSDALLVSSPSLEQRLQPGSRIMLWQTLLAAVRESPWVGYGWTQVGLATQAVSLEHITNQGTLTNSHNIVIDLLLWNGVPLGLLLVGILVWWFARHVSRSRDAESWLLVAAVGAVFLHALLEFPLEYAYFLLPVGLMIGVLDESDTASVAWQLPQMALALPLLVTTCMLAWVGVEYMKVEEAARTMRFVLAGVGVDKVSTAPPPDVALLDARREIHKFWFVVPRAGMSSQELDWMRRVQQRYAVPPAQFRYAMAAGLNGRVDDARDSLIRLCYMHPIDRCRVWHGVWQSLQRKYESLGNIPFPDKALQVLTAAK